MTVPTFRYVPHYRAPDFLEAGWIFAADLGFPHSAYSLLMEWAGEGEPFEPRAT